MFLTKLRQRLSLTQQFMFISSIILLSGMFAIGWWVATRIENAVIEHGAKVTALYMNTFIPPLLEDMTNGQNIDEVHQHMLRHLLSQTPLTDNIIWLNVWTSDLNQVYSNQSASQTLPVNAQENLEFALSGNVFSSIVRAGDQQRYPLIHTIVPVFDAENGTVDAVVESYQDAESLLEQIAQAQYQSWLVVGMATVIMYLLLSGLVRGANQTILRQQRQLETSVVELRSLLKENQDLHTALKEAAVRASEVNEQFLHRLGHDLHDGPAQDIALALLRIGDLNVEKGNQANTIQHALESALSEIRTITSGLQLPELSDLSLENVALRALREFKRKTNIQIAFEISDTLPHAPLVQKQLIYRSMTEAFNNSYKHADAIGLNGCLGAQDDCIYLEISDSGKGFDSRQQPSDHDRLGLIGLQQRVALIAGTIQIQSAPDHGTKIIIKLPIGGNNDE